MRAPEPGWYPDPGSAAAYRWWDGAAWSRWLSDHADAGSPGPAPVVAVPPEPPASAGPEPSTQAAAPVAPTATGEVRLPVAVALVALALAVAVFAVGALASAGAPRLPSGPAVPPPSADAGQPAVVYDAATRTAAVEELRLVLPAEPYACNPSPQPALPTFSSVLVCSAPVHPDYDAGGHDWSASTGLGLVPAALITRGDLQATAADVLASLREQFFATQPTTVRRTERQTWDGAPMGRSAAVTAEIHYRVPGVPSRHDRTSVLVVELRSGGHGFWFSSRPDDSPVAVRDALETSLAGMTAR